MNGFGDIGVSSEPKVPPLSKERILFLNIGRMDGIVGGIGRTNGEDGAFVGN